MLVKILVIISIWWMGNVEGHGMMLEPPNRSSLWRFNDSQPKNYNDNQNFCGGFNVQWGQFGGKCGVCGDKFNDSHPQDNENTGKYGGSGVVRRYKSGSTIDVYILLTANHNGFFKYSLCALKNPNSIEPGEKCFQSLLLDDGSPTYPVKHLDAAIHNKVKLPKKLKCKRCVLRWHYNAGNNWGVCTNGTSGLGCGPQETFRSCADIQIY